MRIIVVCGAGASSTFVAVRLRRAAEARGLPLEAKATGQTQLDAVLPGADVILVGAHLAEHLDSMRRRAAAASVAIAVLPEDAATAIDGDALLDLALAAARAGSGAGAR